MTSSAPLRFVMSRNVALALPFISPVNRKAFPVTLVKNAELLSTACLDLV